MAKIVSLAIDAVGVVTKIAEGYNLDLPSKIVMFHYDEEADTLYVHFEYPSKAVDSEVVDKQGEVIIGLDQEGHIVNITVINALTHKAGKSQ